MPRQEPDLRYGLVAQLLHWTIAALVAVQWLLAERAEDLPVGLEKLATLAQHKSFGLTVLTLAMFRLLWRFAVPPPPMPPMPAWQAWVARATHWSFYALLLALPLTGWMMSSAFNYPVSWFGLLQLPDLVAPAEDLAEFLEDTHETLANTLFLLAGLHIAAALKHTFLDGDGLLLRMLPFGRRR